MAPAPPGAPRPTTEQVLARLPSFGYQFYFASPEAAFELAEAADVFFANAHSPVFRRARKARAPQPGAGDWVKFGNVQKKVHEIIVKKRAGELANPAPEDKVSCPLDWRGKREERHAMRVGRASERNAIDALGEGAALRRNSRTT